MYYDPYWPRQPLGQWNYCPCCGKPTNTGFGPSYGQTTLSKEQYEKLIAEKKQEK